MSSTLRKKLTFWVNGKEIVSEEGKTLLCLLQDFSIGHETQGVAVAMNDEVIPRESWEKLMITEQARIEIVHAVQGG